MDLVAPVASRVAHVAVGVGQRARAGETAIVLEVIDADDAEMPLESEVDLRALDEVRSRHTRTLDWITTLLFG